MAEELSNSPMGSAEQTRAEVSRAYAAALARAERGSGGCCGPSSGEDVAASLVDYGADARDYQQVAQTSFGCGNPLAFVEVQAGQTVLDLGSGAGLDLLIAADRVGEQGRVIGVDMTAEMVEKARANVAAAGRSEVIEVRQGLIEELPVDSASVDWVISNCVINLSPDKPRVFAEIARVLRPGGRFSISDIVVEELPQWIRDNVHAYSACVAGAISEPDYLAGLRAAGLEASVRERLVYDRAQLRAMVSTEVQGLLEGGAFDPALIEQGLAAVEGKVWSAKLVGQRVA